MLEMLARQNKGPKFVAEELAMLGSSGSLFPHLEPRLKLAVRNGYASRHGALLYDYQRSCGTGYSGHCNSK